MSTSLHCLPQTDDIAELVDQITSTFIDAHARPVPTTERGGDDLWTGCVTVDGPLKGAVIVVCPRSFALRVGGVMYATTPSKLSDDDAREALAEFTNVVGGNLKSLISNTMGDTCRMGLPVVTDGDLRVPGEVDRREVQFACADAIVSVRVLEVQRPVESLKASELKV